jgi:hypothetical protein
MYPQYRLNSENCRVFQINFQKKWVGDSNLWAQVHSWLLHVSSGFCPWCPTPHSERIPGRNLVCQIPVLPPYFSSPKIKWVWCYFHCMYSMRTKMMASSSLIMIMTLFPLLIISPHTHMCVFSYQCVAINVSLWHAILIIH